MHTGPDKRPRPLASRWSIAAIFAGLIGAGLGASPVAASASAPPVSVNVISYSSWTEKDTGFVHIVGQLRNDTADNAALFQVDLNLKDSGGNTVQSQPAYPAAAELAPGEISPFEATIAPTPDWYASFSVADVQFARATSSPYHDNLPVTIGICPASMPAQELCGSVQNTGPVEVENVRAVLTFLDGSGVMVAQNAVYIDPTPMNALVPGETGTFSVDRTGDPGFASVVGMGEADYPVDLNPDSVDFGTQLVGTTSPPETVTLTNNSLRDLALPSIVASRNFAVSNTTCPLSLPAGFSCAISVTFAPTATGPYVGWVTITNDAAGNPDKVKLTGSGVAPMVNLVPSAGTDFGSVAVGHPSAPKTVTLTNTGSSDLHIATIVRTGDFSQLNDCPPTLAVSASCRITVTFQPSVSGPRQGSLEVHDDAAGGTQVLPLSGVGLGPAISFNPTSLYFGDQNTPLGPQNVMLINSGTVDLTINSITATSGFTVVQGQGCAPVLHPGASCALTVSLSPGASGRVEGNVTVSTNELSARSVHLVANTGAPRNPSKNPAGGRRGANSGPPPPRG